MKTAFVTGGNRGLGLELVKELLAREYSVFATVRRRNEVMADDLYREPRLRWITFDVTHDAAIESAVQIVGEYADHLNLLVNNAGVNRRTVAENASDSVSKLGKLDRRNMLRMFDVNAVGPVMVTQALLPLLRKARPGFVVNVGSSRGSFDKVLAGETANHGYAGSKMALRLMTRSVAGDLLRMRAEVNIFMFNPGRMVTGMRDNGQDPAIPARQCIDLVENWDPKYLGSMVNGNGTIHPL